MPSPLPKLFLQGIDPTYPLWPDGPMKPVSVFLLLVLYLLALALSIALSHWESSLPKGEPHWRLRVEIAAPLQ